MDQQKLDKQHFAKIKLSRIKKKKAFNLQQQKEIAVDFVLASHLVKTPPTPLKYYIG